MIESRSLQQVITQCIGFIEKNDLYSYDHFDALTSPVLRFFSLKNRLLERIFIQINGKLPFNFRITGTKKLQHTKAISDMLMVYSILYGRSGSPQLLEKAKKMLELLVSKAQTNNNGIAWGLNFQYSTRFTTSTPATINLYSTVFAGFAILSLYESTGDASLKILIEKIRYSLEHELGYIQKSPQSLFFRYYPNEDDPIINVNALALWFFDKSNSLFKFKIFPDQLISGILNFILETQNEDGSWWYAITNNGRWVDGFHTGYVIESLINLSPELQNERTRKSIEKAFQYFINNFITRNNETCYFPRKIYPVDAQNSAQIIQTLSSYYNVYPEQADERMLNGLIQHTLDNLYNQKGYFYFRKMSNFTYKLPYFRWSQTPMILSLISAVKFQAS
jgi:hypothetical protein